MEEKWLVPRKKAEVVSAGEQLPSIQEVIQLAPVLIESGMFPGVNKPPEAVAKILLGREMGVGPVTSLQLIDVVRGRLRPRAQLIATLLKRSGRYDYRIKKLDDKECVIEFLDRGVMVYESHWTMADAERAGVVKPDSAWKTYPREMLFSRAMSTGALKVCPEVMGGAEPLEINGGYDVVEGVATPEGEPPAEAWTNFWLKADELGFPSRDEVHAALGVASVKDYIANVRRPDGSAPSLEDALVVLRKKAAERDINDLFPEQTETPGVAPSSEASPPAEGPDVPSERPGGTEGQSEGVAGQRIQIENLLRVRWGEFPDSVDGNIRLWCDNVFKVKTIADIPEERLQEALKKAQGK